MTDKRVVGGYWLWQVPAYGKSSLIDGQKADVYKSRIMPSTPQGDYVVTALNPEVGDKALDDLYGMSLDEARDHLLSKEGFEWIDQNTKTRPKE